MLPSADKLYGDVSRTSDLLKLINCLPALDNKHCDFWPANLPELNLRKNLFAFLDFGGKCTKLTWVRITSCLCGTDVWLFIEILRIRLKNSKHKLSPETKHLKTYTEIKSTSKKITNNIDACLCNGFKQ